MTSSASIELHRRNGHTWREAGQADRTIVLLHPIVGTTVFWTPQLAELSDTWRCVAWDAPGYCGTSPVKPPLAAAVTARLLDFLDTAKIDRPHLVGLSLGAMFALHAAGHHPDRFDRLVVADTSAAFGIDPEQWLMGWLESLHSGQPLTAVVDQSIEAITSRQPDPSLRKQIVDSFGDVSNEGFEVASRYIASHDVTDLLPSLNNDVLVLVGEHDGETPPEYGEQIAALLPHATFRELAGLGHLTSLEAPEVFSGCVRSFLTATPRS